jgi:hypothetical protein
VPNGAAHVPNGPAHVPNGAAHVPNGSAHVPNGAAHVPNGVAHVPNGVAHVPNGAAHVPNGPARVRNARVRVRGRLVPVPILVKHEYPGALRGWNPRRGGSGAAWRRERRGRLPPPYTFLKREHYMRRGCSFSDDSYARFHSVVGQGNVQFDEAEV